MSAIILMLVQALGGLLATVGSVLVGVGIRWLLNKTKLDGLIQDDIIRGYLDQALENAIQFGIDKLEDKADDLELDLKNEVLNDAIQYVLRSVPDALDHFGITEDRLEELIIARLRRVLSAEYDDILDDILADEELILMEDKSST